ncbi:ceramide synthase 2-like protein [Labeo rohita]|uniref:Ceramide synthase 2-like protein n=1 Tax=Labeo rohita TaxID=84645 RepID=A0A498ML77_LABRO|nr:ceramide synthase 2-like protein [Labeo rohita]
MDASGLDFQCIFGLLRAGSAPSLSSEDLASRISSCVSQTANTPAPSVTQTDVMCLCLTLTESIISRLTAQSLPQDATVFYEDVTKRLFGEMNLMAKLGGSNWTWRRTCAEVFEKSVSSSELDSCLWSLTAVIKGVLRGDTGPNKRDVLTKILSGLDSSITSLYTNLLTPDTQEPHKTELMNLSKTMCEFFDLLEVFNAARLRYGVCSSVQRLIFAESRALLHIMRADVEYFVKKRALLFLKRSLLRRAGEDWASAEVHCQSHEDHGLMEDMLIMADGVLQEVTSGWLKEVPVKAQASFFGGNCEASLSETQKDDVILRGVSLILVKSLEINIQSPQWKGSQSDIDVCGYLTELMSFLQHHGSLVSPDAHSCSWVSVVFAEQDDDMMESAKTLIGLYLYQKSLSSSVSEVCVWGCNPHCHFILLLRSLSFDHSVLLDFLISSETCFLEYCVRYLKLLRDDRAAFCNDVPRLVDYGSSDESEEAEEHVSDRNSGNTQVAIMIGTISEWLWWDRLWLPGNLTWADLKDVEGLVYARASHLYVTVPYALVFLVVRYLFERLIATPLAASLGIIEKTRYKVEHNAVLEHHFITKSKHPGKADIEGLCKKCSWSSRQVERWFRKRRNQDRPSVLKKFREASWRMVFYLVAFIGGIIALYDSMLESQYWYYIVEMSFYLSLVLRITFDVKRKDFKEQIIHHWATLTLLAFSWCGNYIRVGTLVMLVHDSSDILLESAKIFNYAKWERTCNGIFVVFAVVFIATRIIIFPFWIIHCTWVYPPDYYPPFFGYYFFNLMLVILLMLHIFWAYLILRMVKMFVFGSLTKDERSDNEEDEEEDGETSVTEDNDGHVKVTNGCGGGGGANHH